MRRDMLLLIAIVVAMLVSAGCAAGPQATPPPPTKTPKPTFTLTPDWSPTPAIFPTATPVPATPTPEATATPEATDTPTPLPAPSFTANQEVNARSGPGTSYPRVGTVAAGESHDIIGKNQAGDWLEFVFDGDPAWVTADLVTLSGDTGSIEVAQNIPAPPAAPTARPRPQPTSPPPPTSPPQPPPSQYEYSQAKVVRCDPQAGGTWFDGTVKKGGQPVNGLSVVWSYAPDGPWVTDPVTSGPHPGYPGWSAGYFSHIIGAPPNPRAGTWFVWIVDGNGKRISEIASWTSTGPGEGGCNQANLEFNG